MRNVPTTKKESIYFGMMMCGGMVLVMTMYNMLINDVIGHITLAEGILNLVITFAVAMAVETFFVGPVAKKVAFSLPFDKSKQLKVVLILSSCMVIGMVLSMSVYGLITMSLTKGLQGEPLLSSYALIVIKNFIVAYPLQLLIMGPLVRLLFMKFVKKNPAAA
jgi:hypothetical protein